MEERKIEERRILGLFRQCFEDFPKGALKAAESPDFILHVGPRKKIGLEITRLQMESPGESLSMEAIEKCLKAKEEKLPLYRRKRLQEYWLILVLHDPGHLPAYNLKNKLSVWRFESGFNRVFLFEPAGGRIYSLRRRSGS